MGLKTRTSKKVFSYLPPHTTFADRSSLAPSCKLAEAPSSWLGATGCKSGSTCTSLHTSVSSDAVMSLISLCLWAGNPPLAQDNAWSTEKACPHLYFDGSLGGDQPWRNANASWKADLCKVNPCSARGRTVSHVEALFSTARASWPSVDLVVVGHKYSQHPPCISHYSVWRCRPCCRTDHR